MDFVCKLYGNTYAVHVTVTLVGVATLNLALPAPPPVARSADEKHPQFSKIYNFDMIAIYIGILIYPVNDSAKRGLIFFRYRFFIILGGSQIN